MKKIVLFDIDLTLFNYDILLDLFYKEVSRVFNIKLHLLPEARQKYKDTLASGSDFTPDDFTQFIAKEFEIDTQKVNEIFTQNKELYVASLYPDVKPALDILHGEYELGIFSQGFIEYQTLKLVQSGIYSYFNKQYIFISGDKLAPEMLANLPDNCCIIDDRLSAIEALLLDEKIIPIWLNRSNDKTSLHIEFINSLSELPELLKKISD